VIGRYALWLEIGVRSNGVPVDFRRVSPRQELTPTPYAIYASDAGTAVEAHTVSPGSIHSSSLAHGAVTQPALAEDAVTSTHIVDGTITASDVSPNTFWNTTGNGGTTPGTQFLGTTDNQPLELKVDNTRGLRIEPGIWEGDPNLKVPNLIGGSYANWVRTGTVGNVIGGGGSAQDGSTNYINAGNYNVIGGGWKNSIANGWDNVIAGGAQNVLSSEWGSIVGGFDNHAASDFAAIGGGGGNTIESTAPFSSIGGGHENTINSNAEGATIGGGYQNAATDATTTVAGGWRNVAGANAATVAGGADNSATGPYSTIAGGNGNSATNASTTVAGGWRNLAGANAATVAGGADNLAIGPYSTIGGGDRNTIETNAHHATIGGGDANLNGSLRATISGGYDNRVGAGADNSVIGGGRWNAVQEGAYDATIPGGQNNQAGSPYTFAAGRRAKANHTGAFVWADSSNADFASGSSNQFLIRAAGGVGIGTTNPQAALHVAGVVKAAAFISDGSQLSGPPVGMVLIPAGEFTMGDALDGLGDATPVSVTLSAFYMDVHEVSWSRWQSVYFWATNHGYDFVSAGAGKAANHPVHSLYWFDCVKWCNARSQQAGLTPVYYTDAGLAQVYTNGEVSPYANWTANGYRLPTEAEWEKAARGGLSGQRFPWGNVINQNLANYHGTDYYSYDLGPYGHNPAFTNGPMPYTSPGGYFAPNSYGLYDMAGNVMEWCWDWYLPSYVGGIDPRGPPYGVYRVLRGGSWIHNAYSSRCAARNDTFVPDDDYFHQGFRCVRGL
jgi:formylglycine-generating enzyme required for sulfatase activity